MTHFGFHGNHLSVYGGSTVFFLQKPQTKDTVQMAIVLVLNESSNNKIALYTYLRPTLNGYYVGWS